MSPKILLRAARHVDGVIRRALANQNGGVVPFRMGRFAVTADRPSFSARIFYETRQVDRALSHLSASPGRVIEVGCGYGRLTPWLADRAESFTAIEPDGSARRRARELYPHVDIRAGTAQDIRFPDSTFDLVVTWTVLQHIPDGGIDAALNELARVTAPGGHLLLTEKTAGDSTPIVAPRPVRWYADRLDGFELIEAEPRRVEPEFGETHCHVMLFRGES